MSRRGPNHRITVPDGLAVGAFEDPTSEIRRVVPVDAVPRVQCSVDDLKAFPLDSRDGFVVSLVDGRSSVTTILDAAAASLDEGEVMEILARLVRLGVIELRDAALRPIG